MNAGALDLLQHLEDTTVLQGRQLGCTQLCCSASSWDVLRCAAGRGAGTHTFRLIGAPGTDDTVLYKENGFKRQNQKPMILSTGGCVRQTAKFRTHASLGFRTPQHTCDALQLRASKETLLFRRIKQAVKFTLINRHDRFTRQK